MNDQSDVGSFFNVARIKFKSIVPLSDCLFQE